MASTLHLVVPGQVIATSSSGNEEDSFLRGHGTYLETVQNENRLVASVCGIVERVNKLITVVPCSSNIYQGNVGDLVVGRVVSVGATRWRVSLLTGNNGRDAQLPLSGVHLPGGVQRVRTAQDQRDMRQFFTEGDLVSAEVHNVYQDGTLVLHTRSTRYGKLENGCLVTVPPSLIPRRKNHYLTILDRFDVLWGMNGHVWIQRKLRSTTQQQGEGGVGIAGDKELTDEIRQKIRKEHAETPVEVEDRLAIVRLRNAIECLRLVHCMVTPESVEAIYKESSKQKIRPANMLLPDNIIQLTASSRK